MKPHRQNRKWWKERLYGIHPKWEEPKTNREPSVRRRTGDSGIKPARKYTAIRKNEMCQIRRISQGGSCDISCTMHSHQIHKNEVVHTRGPARHVGMRFPGAPNSR